MDIIRKGIFHHIVEINILFDKITKKTYKDLANLWTSINEIIQIQALVFDIINADINKFAEIPEIEKHAHSIFASDKRTQIGLINQHTIQEWHTTFCKFIVDFRFFIFRNYIYFLTYDTFSEGGRDNEQKIRTLSSLTHHNELLLEIGPGTGPLLRRLLKSGYNVTGLEYDEVMIKELISKCPQAKIIHQDFFECNLGNETFNMIFIESGLFLFTLLRDVTPLKTSELVFEIYERIDEESLVNGLKKIFDALKPNGQFLIGIQGMMEKIQLDEDLFFSMKRIQREDHAYRKLTYYIEEKGFMGLYKKRKIIYFLEQQKPTMSYEKFVSLAKSFGFKEIFPTPDKQWLVIKK